MYIVSKLSLFAVAALQLLLVDGAPTPIEDSKTSELDGRGLAPVCSAGVSTTEKRLFQLNGRTQYFAGLFPKIAIWTTTDT